MKSALIIIADKDFRDEEYQVPKDIFEKADIKVVTASTTLNEVKGKLGLKVKPDILLKDADMTLFDALIFVGGNGAEQYFNDENALKLAKEAYQKNKVYAAICIAPVILANAGLLQNKKSTSFLSEINILKEKGAIYVNEEVVVDGKLVTADGPKSAKKFGEAIVKLLR